MRLEIGSPRGMGQIVSIRATDPFGAWVQLYSGDAFQDLASSFTETKTYVLYDTCYMAHAICSRYIICSRYWNWAPEGLCRSHFLTSQFRIEVDTTAATGIDEWNYIDYVQVFGTTSLQEAALRIDASAVIYVPDEHANGADSFEFRATEHSIV